ncbi:polysaccharide pyruvyl transferase family protein [Runella zeae]|uniref:polysaccharide pyruvyl transferase family protein n=1 Tax=Runella zeae TaxID=94255 RepID=UPI0023532BEC|nr:polysaccharide pyruvyl transferase family protein [Runella zeae]
MKIGILTFHSAHNYGAVLQAYATKEFLKGLGYDANIIDYRPGYIKDEYEVKYTFKGNLIKLPLRFIKYFILRHSRKRRFNKFEIFINDILNPVSSELSIPADLDVYVVGSDQIWNPKITKGFDRVFFVDFNFQKRNKVYISYAASMETSNLTSKESKFLAESLNRFDSISVREYELLKLLQPLINKEIYKVLDPTFLLTANRWKELAKIKRNDSKYVLVYQVREDSRTIKIAKQIASQLEAKIVQLVAWVSLSNFVDSTVAHDASPEEFLGYIKNAECVVTTSFHGTAFSVIFQKNFYYVALKDGKNTRASSLLNSINLENRMIDIDSRPTFTTIDYKDSEILLNEQIDRSSEFLKMALSKFKN